LHLAAAEGDPRKGHFVVVFEYRSADRKLGIIDPSSGGYHYAEAANLLRSYSGYILLPEDRLLRPLLAANCIAFGGVIAVWVWRARGNSRLGTAPRCVSVSTVDHPQRAVPPAEKA
jgi:hypothetical protein